MERRPRQAGRQAPTAQEATESCSFSVVPTWVKRSTRRRAKSSSWVNTLGDCQLQARRLSACDQWE